MTMFGFFAFNGICDLMYHYRVPLLPPDLDYLSASMAFAAEGFLFAWHLRGRPPMDVQVHTFVVYVAFLCATFCVLEMKYKNDVRVALARAGFTLAMGTWFWMVGFILYPPWGEQWADDDHEQMMIITMMFCWNIAGVLVFQMCFAVVMYCLAKRYYGQVPKTPKQNGYARVANDELQLNILGDSDSEV